MDQRFLIELDALLDTRLGTIALIDDQLAKSFLTDEYANRISDEFHKLNPALDIDLYRRAYADRDIETLMASAPTDISLFLNPLINTLSRNAESGSPTITKLEVEVNYYPYQLSEALKEEFAVCITASLCLDQRVTMVYHPTAHLTTDYILANKWTMLVLYNLSEWHNAVFGKITTPPTPIPTVVVLVPFLLNSVDDVVAEMQNEPPTKQRITPFDAYRIMLADYIGIKFMPTADFSLVGLTKRDVEPTKEDPSVA